jgi:hypothetical protein
MAHAAETARMSANTIRHATVSTQSSGPSSAMPAHVVVWILVAIAFIAALAFTGGGSAPMMGHYYLASDEALKTDIKRVGTSEQGFGIYEFRYKGQAQRVRGAMAQDVMRLRPEAVKRHENGFLMVDYGQIDVRPALID